MYYNERYSAGKMRRAMAIFQEEMQKTYFKDNKITGTVHENLVNWGVAIRARFEADNLHLNTRKSEACMVQLTHAVTTLSQSVSLAMGNMHACMHGLQERMDQRMHELGQRMEGLESKVVNAVHKVQDIELSMQADIKAVATLRDSRAEAAGSSSAQTAASQHTPIAEKRVRESEEGGEEGDDDDDGHGQPPAKKLAPLWNRDFGSLIPANQNTVLSENVSLKGKSATSLWADMVWAGGQLKLTKQDRCRAQLVEHWFSGMALEEEKKLFKKPCAGGPKEKTQEVDDRQQKVLKYLHKLVIAYLIGVLQKVGDQIPDVLTKEDYSLPAGALAERFADLKKRFHDIDSKPTATAFKSFRAAFEAQHKQYSVSSPGIEGVDAICICMYVCIYIHIYIYIYIQTNSGCLQIHPCCI